MSATIPIIEVNLSELLNSVNLAVVTTSDKIFSYRTAYCIAKNCTKENQKVHIFTNFIDECQNLINDSNDYDVINCLGYDQVNEITDFGNRLVIFDDIESLYNLENKNILRILLENNDSIVAICNYDTIYLHRDEKSPDEKTLYDLIMEKFSIDEPTILLTYSLTSVKNLCEEFSICYEGSKLTKLQKEKINTINYVNELGENNLGTYIKNECTEDSCNTLNELIQYANIVYPFNIEQLIENGENLPDIDALFETIGCAELLKNAPKIKKLHDIILNTRRFDDTGPKQRHIIYTFYPGYYGAQFLQSLFNYSDSTSTDENDNFNCIFIDPFNSFEDNEVLMNNWNNELDATGDFKHQILIICGALITMPILTDHYHILDTNIIEAYAQYINIIKSENYNRDELKFLKNETKNPITLRDGISEGYDSATLHLHYTVENPPTKIPTVPDNKVFESSRTNDGIIMKILYDKIHQYIEDKKIRLDKGCYIKTDSKNNKFFIEVPVSE